MMIRLTGLNCDKWKQSQPSELNFFEVSMSFFRLIVFPAAPERHWSELSFVILSFFRHIPIFFRNAPKWTARSEITPHQLLEASELAYEGSKADNLPGRSTRIFSLLVLQTYFASSFGMFLLSKWENGFLGEGHNGHFQFCYCSEKERKNLGIRNEPLADFPQRQHQFLFASFSILFSSHAGNPSKHENFSFLRLPSSFTPRTTFCFFFCFDSSPESNVDDSRNGESR